MEYNLTKFEKQVLTDLLYGFSFALCYSGCYCDYKRIDCEDRNANGVYKCKLCRAIESIQDKLQLELWGE